MVAKGWAVRSLTRRGDNPKPGDDLLDQVEWLSGDATDFEVVKRAARGCDAVVHACGLLFDVDSGLQQLNLIVSGSQSRPGPQSTYEKVTTVTAKNALEAIKRENPMLPLFAPKSSRPTMVFVSAAEAGWPDVALGPRVEAASPEWLKRYLACKREVEGALAESAENVRAVVFRPSLIWTWSKLDVLPVIPFFNIASAAGVPFVDKTVRVEDLADAIVASLDESSIEGVQTFRQIEELAATERQ